MPRAKSVRVVAIALAAAVAGVGHFAAAQHAAQPLFADDAPLALTLEGPFRELGRVREQEPEFPATLSYVEADGRRVVVPIEIKPRGISRLRHCRFPPLRLEFEERSVAGTLFEGQDELKLVTHCMPSTIYEDFVAREYLTYRLFNALTDQSFRVRWLAIDYIDTDTDREAFTSPAFFIEAEWAAAQRLGMEVLDVDVIDSATLDPQAAALTALFHFMIGNADWSALKGPPDESCCHNGKPLGVPGRADGRIVLPYDFDQAAYVDAAYAVHNEGIGLRGDQRSYRGSCELNAELHRALERLAAAAPRWLEIAGGDPLRERARRHGLRYIEQGYEILSDPRSVERRIVSSCRSVD